MATLINGDGNAAVYAAQDSDWFAGVEGNTTKILKVGAKMEYEIEDANTIAIKNGVLVTKEGRRVQIDAGAIDEFIIPTGTQGVTRYFIIGYHLYTDASSNQLCETFVQLMANGTDTIPEDTFRGGSTDVYVSLYRVKQDGITLDTIQSLLPEGVDLDGIEDEIDDIKDDIVQINSDLTEKATKVWIEAGTVGVLNTPVTIPTTGVSEIMIAGALLINGQAEISDTVIIPIHFLSQNRNFRLQFGFRSEIGQMQTSYNKSSSAFYIADEYYSIGTITSRAMVVYYR